MGAISWTPAIREALNTVVLNNFTSGTISATQRISGLLDICGVKPADAKNIVTLVLGKNFKLRRRSEDLDTVKKRGINIYEQRAQLAPYVDFISIDRDEALFPGGINKVAAAAETAGASVAEGPTRMVEALVPVALSLLCHTGQNFFDTDHPVKPGSSDTWANLADLGALDFASFDEAVRRLKQIPDEDGHASGSRVRVLAVGPADEVKGLEILKATRPLAYAGENFRTQYGAQLVVVPDWDGEFWAVFDTDLDNDRPFYYVEGRPLRVKDLFTNPDGTYEFINNELLWGIDGHMAVALGNPRRALMAADPADKATIVAKYSKKFKLNDFGFELS